MILKKKLAGGEVRVTFVLPGNHQHGAVAVVGDFNNWDPETHTLKKRSNKTFSTTVTLPAGSTYVFRYLGEGGQWFDEDAADGYRPNEYGSGNCLLHT